MLRRPGLKLGVSKETAMPLQLSLNLSTLNPATLKGPGDFEPLEEDENEGPECRKCDGPMTFNYDGFECHECGHYEGVDDPRVGDLEDARA